MGTYPVSDENTDQSYPLHFFVIQEYDAVDSKTLMEAINNEVMDPLLHTEKEGVQVLKALCSKCHHSKLTLNDFNFLSGCFEYVEDDETAIGSQKYAVMNCKTFNMGQ